MLERIAALEAEVARLRSLIDHRADPLWSAGLGPRLKQQRERCGLTQVKLAAVSGVSAAHISYLERGIREPGWAVLRKLARALNTSAELLAPIGDAS